MAHFQENLYNIRCNHFKNRVLTYEIKFSQKLTNSMESGFGGLFLSFGNTNKDKHKSFLEQFIDFWEKCFMPNLSIFQF